MSCESYTTAVCRGPGEAAVAQHQGLLPHGAGAAARAAGRAGRRAADAAPGAAETVPQLPRRRHGRQGVSATGRLQGVWNDGAVLISVRSFGVVYVLPASTDVSSLVTVLVLHRRGWCVNDATANGLYFLVHFVSLWEYW